MSNFLGLAVPVIQAPMAGVQGSALAIAVSNAGGVGSLPCAMLSPEAMRAEVALLKAQMHSSAGAPGLFNLNFFCHQPPVANPVVAQAWLERLQPYYQACGIDPATIAPVASRQPFNEAMLAVVEEARPAVVSFHFGLPEAGLLARVKRCGAKVMSSATTVAEAVWLEANGADVVIAQGLEAGGHRGMFLTDDLTTQTGTFALLPQIVDAVRVPVVAAGGIVDARGVKAALALGAVAVQVGTAYLLCPEATTSAIHRAALQSPAARHTAVTNIFTGRPARGIVNRFIREQGPLNALAPPFPLATLASAPLRSCAEAQGSGDFSPLWAGQNAQGCQAIPAAQLTRQLASLL